MSTQKQLPNFLCIGAQKAATSWLWVMLKQHPDVWMPPFKEIHFFDHLYMEENRNWTLGHIKRGVKDSLKWHTKNDKINLEYFKYLIDISLVNPFTEEWYYRCFDREAATDKVLGDITPEYCTIPVEGIQYVKSLLGDDLKIIYIVRDPLSRSLSQLKMNVTRKGNEMNDENYWLEESREPVLLQRGDYATYIPKWISVFGASNIHFVPFKKIKSDPNEVLRNISSFIGLKKHSFNGSTNRVHQTKQAIVPGVAAENLKLKLGSQYEFLNEFFDADFIANI